jgi:hypothetical protein
VPGQPELEPARDDVRRNIFIMQFAQRRLGLRAVRINMVRNK